MSTVSNSVNSVNSFNSVNSVHCVNSVNSYSAVLPPSPMVFFSCTFPVGGCSAKEQTGPANVEELGKYDYVCNPDELILKEPTYNLCGLVDC